MFEKWVARGLKKPGKDQYGLADALGVDRSVISKILAGKRILKANELERVASYIEEAPPNRVMKIALQIGAGQEVFPVDHDDLGDAEVSGFWGIEADLAIVRGDSMWPLLSDGGRVFIGARRPPHTADNRQMRAVRLADGRVFIKVMRKTADPNLWTLESYNAPPIEDVAVEAVGEILRIEPRAFSV